jgi:hypothetical protein
METNVSHTVPPDDERDLLDRARPYVSPSHVDGIGYLIDHGSFWEIHYDGCDHYGAFVRNRTNYDFGQAASFVRNEMAACSTCETQARLARIFADDHPPV